MSTDPEVPQHGSDAVRLIEAAESLDLLGHARLLPEQPLEISAALAEARAQRFVRRHRCVPRGRDPAPRLLAP